MMTLNEFRMMDALDQREWLTEDLAEWRQSGVGRTPEQLRRFRVLVRSLADEIGMGYSEVIRHLSRDADLMIEEWEAQAANDSIAGTTLGY